MRASGCCTIPRRRPGASSPSTRPTASSCPSPSRRRAGTRKRTAEPPRSPAARGQRPIEREPPAALDEQHRDETEREQVVLEALAPLGAGPVHEESLGTMYGGDRADHHGADPERGEARREAHDEEDRREELDEHDADGERRRQPHLLREEAERAGEAVASEPAEDLLRAVREHHDRERGARERAGPLVGGRERATEQRNAP